MKRLSALENGRFRMATAGRQLITGWQCLPDAWRWPVLAWLGAVLLIWGWAGLLQGMGIIPAPEPQSAQPAWVHTWTRNDTGDYLAIAQTGYTTPVLTLFYPLYPLLGRLLHNLTQIPLLACLLILSHLFVLGCLLLLYRLAEPLGGRTVARLSVVALILFPSSFYFFAGYPQSLLLFLVLLAHFLALKEKWWAVCLAGLAAGLTHSTGLVATLPLAISGIQAARRSSSRLRWALILPAGSPVLGVALFETWRRLAGFGSYTEVSFIYFQRIVRMPWQTLVYAVQEAFSAQTLQMMPRINLAILVLLLVAMVWSWTRLPWEYWTYLLAGLGLGLAASSQVEALWSFARTVLAFFPLYVILAQWMVNRKVQRIFTAVLLAGWLLLSAIFLAGGWVA